MRASVLVILVGCGRVGFDVHAIAVHDGATDTTVDAGIPGLVVDFTFDGVVANSYPDSLGGASATCVAPGCPASAPGHHNEGLLFDGVDDCLSISDTRGYFSLPAFTNAIWAHQDSAVGNAKSQFSKRVDIGAVALNSWQLEDYSDGSAAFTSNAGTGTNEQSITATSTIKIGAWQHLAITWDGATKRIYADGVQVIADGQPGILYDGHPALIGCDDNDGVSEVFVGTLDEFQVYNRALEPAELQQLATQ